MKFCLVNVLIFCNQEYFNTLFEVCSTGSCVTLKKHGCTEAQSFGIKTINGVECSHSNFKKVPEL